MPDTIKPTYSLLVPCYNAEKYIDGFLENISLLTRPFDEVIFYDDASTDNTLGLLKSKNLSVIRGDVNRGPGYARNRLGEAANCSHVHFHDIDDELVPEFLEWVDDEFMKKQPDVVFGYADWLDAISRQALLTWQYDAVAMGQNPLAFFITTPLGIINTTYKKEAFLKVSGFNEAIKCWEDADLHVRMAAGGAYFSFIDKVMARSIRHNNGISADQLWCWGCRLKFIEEYLNNYRARVPDEIFRAELKKIETMYIIAGEYKKINNILSLNRRHNLHIKNGPLLALYWAGSLFPAKLIDRAIKYVRYVRTRFSVKVNKYPLGKSS